MPTDEQRMRERFEEVRGKGCPDHVNEYLFQRNEFDNYVLSDMNSQWHGWRMAYRARDAEVQALREALADVQRFVQEWQTGVTVSDYDTLDDISTVIQAAALAGGETGETE